MQDTKKIKFSLLQFFAEKVFAMLLGALFASMFWFFGPYLSTVNKVSEAVKKCASDKKEITPKDTLN